MNYKQPYNTRTRDMSRLEAWQLLQEAVKNMESSATRADQIRSFESLVSNTDAIRLHALGVRL